ELDRPARGDGGEGGGVGDGEARGRRPAALGRALVALDVVLAAGVEAVGRAVPVVVGPVMAGRRAALGGRALVAGGARAERRAVVLSGAAGIGAIGGAVRVVVEPVAAEQGGVLGGRAARAVGQRGVMAGGAGRADAAAAAELVAGDVAGPARTAGGIGAIRRRV